VAVANCRFVIGAIDENEVRDGDGYSLFEPELSFYLRDANVFGTVYRKPTCRVVIMHAREQWLEETISLVRDANNGLPSEAAYDYDLVGTEYSIVAVARGDGLDVYTAKEDRALRTPRPAGRVTVREWVRAIADVSRQLSDVFRRLQPGLFSDPLFQREERALQELESWLNAGTP